MNFVLLFEVSVMKMLTKSSTIWRKLRFRRNASKDLVYFLSGYGTCSIEPLKSFHEQMISRLGIIVSKSMFHPLTQRSGSSYMFYWDKKTLFEWECFKTKNMSTIIQISKLWTICNTLLITFFCKILYINSHSGLFWKKFIL